MLESLREWGCLVIGYWRALVLGGAMDIAALYQAAVNAGWSLPTFAADPILSPFGWFSMSLLVFLAVSFVAFHRVRVERDRARAPRPDPIDFKKEDQEDEWPLYQVAFLWHDYDPPPYNREDEYATRSTYDTKRMLHDAVDRAELNLSRQTPHARYTNRHHLRQFCAEQGIERPAFLRREERQE